MGALGDGPEEERLLLGLALFLLSRGGGIHFTCVCDWSGGAGALGTFLETILDFGLPNLIGLSNTISWFYSTSLVVLGHIRTIIPLLVLWFLWKRRNKERHEGLSGQAREVVFMVEQFIDQLGRARMLSGAAFRGDQEDPWSRWMVSGNLKCRAMTVSWRRPPSQCLMLNTDASVSNGRAHGGGLLRDSIGRLIFAFYKEFGELDVLSAESFSQLYGLQRCSEGLKG